MTKYRVWLPEQERIIEADSEDEAQQIFEDGDDIFDFLEVEPAADEHDPNNCSICEDNRAPATDDIPW